MGLRTDKFAAVEASLSQTTQDRPGILDPLVRRVSTFTFVTRVLGRLYLAALAIMTRSIHVDE
jgi:hypothetical protein